MKSASFNLISSPTRYFNTDLVGSNLIVLSAHIVLLLFIIELHNILISNRGAYPLHQLAINNRCSKPVPCHVHVSIVIPVE
jgi:hypothetical protein